MAERVREERAAGGKLRALYSGACYGDSHGDAWLKAGFQVVSGAIKVNTNGLHDYPTFLKSWRSGMSFGDAQDKGNDPYWVNFFDRLAERMGFSGPANSFKNVHGRKAVTIATDPTEFAAARADEGLGEPERPTPGAPEPVGGKMLPDGVTIGGGVAATPPWEGARADRTGLVQLTDAVIRKFFP